ncbi:MAG: HEAT repeat domain-containing protein [Candidatus Omnitrophica bacterium]|nr:HEAT repeat domain-containing protein [Candidatus Omnitrophota bacterium]
MRKISIIALTLFFCFLLFRAGLFAVQQEDRRLKPHLDSKYSKIVVCSKVLEALGKIGDPRMKDVLISGFKSNEFLIRTSAIEALGKLKDKTTIPLLKKSLKDDSYIIRILVTKALLNLGDQKMEAKLLEFLNSAQISTRAAAVEQLGQFNEKYLPQLVEVLAKDNSDLVRITSIQQLGINKFHPAITLIEQALKDPNPKIRQAACMAIGQIKDIKTLGLLIERLADDETLVRSAAKEGIAMFKDSLTTPKTEVETLATAVPSEHDQILAALKKDLNSNDPVLRVSSYISLANLEDVTILPLLLKEVVSPENATWVKKRTARALRILKPYVVKYFDELAKSSVISSQNLELYYKVNGKNLLTLIIDAIEDDTNPLRKDAIFILGELKEEASLPALRKALSQDDPNIVANSAYVLGLFQDKEAVPYLIDVCNTYGL